MEDEDTLGGGDIGGLGPSPLGLQRAGSRHDKKAGGGPGMAMRRSRFSSSKVNDEEEEEEEGERLWSVWAERKLWSCGKARPSVTIHSSLAHGSYASRVSHLDVIALSKVDGIRTASSSSPVQSIQSSPRFIIFTSSSCC